MRLKQLILPLLASACLIPSEAANVKVTMNAVSTTMTLESKDGVNVDTGTASGSKVYRFEVPAGEYILTAYATDGKTVNGTLGISVDNSDAVQEFKVITCTMYASNSGWTVEKGDYSIDLKINTREGKRLDSTYGNSITAGRKTFLALSGNSYNVAFIPSEAHAAEGYTTLYKGGTLTANVNVQGAIPMGEDYTITVPSDAGLEIALKFSHFTDFTPVEPKTVEDNGTTKTMTFYLANDQMYFYRTWREGGITNGGYFKMSTDVSKRPVLTFSEKDYKAYDSAAINHDVQSNNGYETGDILLNINERGHLSMNVGDSFKTHAMRVWEISDNPTSNNFIEPDFHYTVVGLDGKPSDNVIEIDTTAARTSAWADIKAVGKGTAIVLVSYDGIRLNYYNNATKNPFNGGEHWGAIWPENTGVFVVTVGEDGCAAEPNMVINQEYNTGALKVAGINVDAEHDVFYYLDTDEGTEYTFTPEGAAEITMAYPRIGERMMSYSGFDSNGVTKNEDGSYTLRLKEGRQIVRITDTSGKSCYQVLTAKSCHREIVNATRPGSKIFQPGDDIKIQYSGLRHPANKIAGIYNMSAYVTYNGIPNGSSLVLGSGQYTFGSSASAQAVSVSVAADHDVAAQPTIELTKGVIQVNGYGDAIGNHRFIDPVAGRSPNFSAVAHKTYFGQLPDVAITLSEVKDFTIAIDCNVAGAEITVSTADKILKPADNGTYSGTYGTYSVKAVKDGYRCYRNDFHICDDAEGLQTFVVDMEASSTAWDGKTLTEPQLADGIYNITTGAELAWFANHINAGNATVNAIVSADLDLGDFDWTPAGNSSSKCYSGNFDGQGHIIKGMYIDTKTNYQGLFGYIKDGAVSGIELYGAVSGKQYVGGIAGCLHQNATIDRCANHATVNGSGTYVGGIAGSLSMATSKITNSYNIGAVSGTSNCGGVAGYNNASATVTNVYNIGDVTGATVAACIGGTTAKANVSNAFAVREYGITTSQTTIDEYAVRSGELAYKLGKAFGQKIGIDEYPVLGGSKVFYNELIDAYYNDISTGIGSMDVEGKVVEAYYNLEGIPSQRPYRGINIIRYSDGTIAKTLF